MNILLLMRGWRLLNQMRRRDRWTRRELEAYQARSLRVLRQYAYARSRFYQRFHQGLEDRPLQELPILTKALLMEHFDEMVTDPALRLKDVEAHLASIRGDERFLGRYRVTATSGQTGGRGIFLFNRLEWLTILAGFGRAMEWTGLNLRQVYRMQTAVSSDSVPSHMTGRVSATLQASRMRRRYLDRDEAIEERVEHLNAWQPEILVGYPNRNLALAEEQIAGRLHIDPRIIMSNAGVLTEGTRRRIEEAWGKKLFDQYAATEAGNIASECTHHRGLHLLEDLVLFEVVDEENCPVPPGVTGEKVLLTVLFGRTQPLIRYELSDRVRLAPGACPCGRPFALIDGFEGRAEEVLRFPTPEGEPVEVRPLTFYYAMDTVPCSGWQIIHEPDGLRVLVSGLSEGFTDAEVVDSIRRHLEPLGVVVPAVHVQRVTAIPRGATGKARYILSNLGQQAPAASEPVRQDGLELSRDGVSSFGVEKHER